MRKYVAYMGKKAVLGIYARNKCTAKDAFRMYLGALWRDDWVSRYSVRIEVVKNV